MDRNNVEVKVSEADCTGCSLCMNVCPTDAIIMSQNGIGHLRPSVNTNICINCSLCIKQCPSLTNSETSNPIKVFAAWACDYEERKTSSSGGIASVLSRQFVNDGGIVYGCSYLPGEDVRHIRIDNVIDLYKLKGSKYVQSKIGLIYRSVKKDLYAGKKVLFIGTPCQIAGLKNFIKNTSNLVTIGLVCHGVPAQKLLFEHLSSLGFQKDVINKLSFRERGDIQYVISVTDENGKSYRKSIFEDLYYSAFNDCLTMRPSCINCHYANINRVEDITVGDFHHLGELTPFLHEKTKENISLVLINTPVGGNLFNNIDCIVAYERSLQEAIAGNPQLREPSRRRANYNLFLKLYPRIGFKWAARICLYKRLIKNRIIMLINADCRNWK